MPITSTQTSQQAANTTTSNVTLPASVAAGDLIIAFIASDSGAGSHTFPSPWVRITNEAVGAPSAWAAIGYLIASGGETSVAVTHSSERSAHIAVRIAAADWHGTTPPEVSAKANATSSAPNSPSLTASWGSEANLWISAYMSDDAAPGTMPVLSYPLTDTNVSNAGPGSAGSVAICAVDETTATKDPAAYSTTGSDDWNAYTLVVRPAAAGGPTTSRGYAQAQADIKAIGRGFGQAQAKIAGPTTQYAQAQARIIPGALLTYTSDTFTRVGSSTWGLADIGGTWVLTGGDAAFSTDGSSGQISLSILITREAYQPMSNLDFDYITQIRADQLSGTTANFIELYARTSDTGTPTDGYALRITFPVDGGSITVQARKRVASSASALGSVFTSSISHDITAFVNVRFRISGTTSVSVQGKIWAIGSGEPDNWNVDVTDATPEAILQLPGNVGLRWQLVGSTTTLPAIAYFDNILVRSIVAVNFGLGQAQAKIAGQTSTTKYAQAQADIKARSVDFSTPYGQANADIKAIGRGFAQSQADIKVTTLVFAQAQADIKASGFGLGQTNADIKNRSTAYSTPYGQANADIKVTTNVFGQANASIVKTQFQPAQSQANIKAIGRGFAQAQADVKVIGYGFGQTQADIKSTGNAFAQAKATIRGNIFGQSQADVKAVGYGLGQAQADIRHTYYQPAQAQADIKSVGYGLGQAQADIRVTTYQFGQAQGTIIGAKNQYAQAQAYIIIAQYIPPVADISNDGWVGVVI